MAITAPGLRIKQIQRGTITLGGGDTSLTATITSVDTTKSIIEHLGSEPNSTAAGGGIDDSTTRVALTNGTTVTATRASSTGSVVVGFQVTEYY